jgi:hypothetical protein
VFFLLAFSGFSVIAVGLVGFYDGRRWIGLSRCHAFIRRTADPPAVARL